MLTFIILFYFSLGFYIAGFAICLNKDDLKDSSSIIMLFLVSVLLGPLIWTTELIKDIIR